jgi:hypothetical protein
MKLVITLDIDDKQIARHEVNAWNPAGLPPTYEVDPISLARAIDEAMGDPVMRIEPCGIEGCVSCKARPE